MTVLWTTLVVVLLVANLAVHEAAHALALKKMGGRIQAAGLGLPLPPQLVLKPRGRRTFSLTLSPWLIGAYVIPDHQSERLIEDAPYWQRAWFAGAGVVANLLVGLAGLALLTAIAGNWLAALAWAGAGVTVWLARKVITFLLPLFGIVALIFLAYILVVSVGEPQGPVGLAVNLAAESGREVLTYTIALSMALAIVNCIPIYPFDGGRVADAALLHVAGEQVARTFRVATGIAAAALLVYVIGSDVVWLVTA